MSRLPVVGSDSKAIRPSRSAPRRAAVLLGVHVLIALHIAHWLATGSTVTPVEPSEAMVFSRDGVVNAGLLFFAAAILLTAIFGRFFCGWGCHILALQDLCRALLARVGIRPQPLRSRLLRWVPAVAFVYMFLWPLAYRLWDRGGPLYRGMELTTQDFWATFPGPWIAALTFLTCGFVIVYFLGSKGFCTYACPYGAAFALADRVSPLRIRVTDACAGCGHCTAVCTSNVRVHEEVREHGMVVSNDCMKCLDCVSVCPNGALYYGAGPLPLGRSPSRGRRLSAWQEVVLGVAFVLAFLSFRGLYGEVPFLMSLGVAAILAYLVLVTARLVREPHLTLRRLRLKRQGRILPAGRVFIAAMAGLALFWLHSGWLRYQHFQGEQALGRLVGPSLAALDLAAPQEPLTAVERTDLAAAGRHLRVVEHWGLVSTRENAARLAWVALLEGDGEALGRWVTLALERREQRAWMHELLAREAWRVGDTAAAFEGWQRALGADPNHELGYRNLGIALASVGELATAEDVLGHGLERLPQAVDLVYNRGIVQAMGGDLGRAIVSFERVLALDPAHLQARENLAGMLASSGRFEESVGHYQKALEQSPEDPATRFLLARALAALDRRTEARHELERVLALEPGHREAGALLKALEDPIGP